MPLTVDQTSCDDRIILALAVIVKPQGMPVFRTGTGSTGKNDGSTGKNDGGGNPRTTGDEDVCACVQSALPYSLAPITQFTAVAVAAAAAGAAAGGGAVAVATAATTVTAAGAAAADEVDGGGGGGGAGVIQLNVLRRPQVTLTPHTLSTHPMNTLTSHPFNPPYLHTLSHPFNPPSQPTLTTHPDNPLYQHSLSIV